MNKWLQIPKEGLIGWLLKRNNPSIRDFTLRDVLGNNDSDYDVETSKHSIPESKAVKRILSKQHPEEHWEKQQILTIPDIRLLTGK